ncbi:MAG: glycosyltransferase family 39 protein [Candidatus Aenigmatarchaeota archaeon]
MKREIEVFIWIFLILIFLLNLHVSFKSPISFGDEGFHSFVANYIAKKLEYPAYIKETGGETYLTFERPPFWNIFEASFIFIFRFIDDSIIIKFLTPFLTFLLGLFTFYLARRAFNEIIALITSILISTIPSIVTYAVLFYTDILATLFYTLFFFLFLIGYKEKNKKFLILSAVFAGFAFLTKVNSIVLFAFYPLVFLINKKDFKLYLQCFLILLLVTSGYFIRNYFEYGTPFCREIPLIGKYLFDLEKCKKEIYKSKYSFEGRTEEVGSEMSVFRMGITNYLKFAYGDIDQAQYYIPFLFFFAGILFSLVSKEKYFREIILINLLFFLIIFFSSTGRSEDTARYTLIFAPVIVLIPSIFVNEFFERYKKKNFLLLFVPIFFLLLYFSKNIVATIISLILLITSIHFYLKKKKEEFTILTSIATIIIVSSSILTNINSLNLIILYPVIILLTIFLIGYFITKKLYENACLIILIFCVAIISIQNFNDKLTTMESVKRFSNLFFEACEWVKNNLPENSKLMTIWASRALYNCKRSAVSNIADISASRDINITLKAINEIGITHIFIQKFSIGNRDLVESQNIEFVRFLERNNNYFKKVFENPVNDACFENCLNGIYIELYGRCPCDGNIIYEVVKS